MEHIHTMPQPWELEDDFERALTWLRLGVDDILDVSVPWSIDPSITWQDAKIPAGGKQACPVLERTYHTPVGTLCHAVRQTGEYPGAGWVIQPENVQSLVEY